MTPMTWSSAQSHCRKKHTDLTSMTNQQEKEAIISVIDSLQQWIGLLRVAWKWSDQSNSSIRQWEIGQPEGPGWENCVAASTKAWDDSRCDQKFMFFPIQTFQMSFRMYPIFEIRENTEEFLTKFLLINFSKLNHSFCVCLHFPYIP